MAAGAALGSREKSKGRFFLTACAGAPKEAARLPVPKKFFFFVFGTQKPEHPGFIK